MRRESQREARGGLRRRRFARAVAVLASLGVAGSILAADEQPCAPADISDSASPAATAGFDAPAPADANEVAELDPFVDPPTAPGGAAVPDDAALEASGAIVGEVIIRAGDVFDPERPGEDRFLFRLANSLHRETRDVVIRRQLLFKPGDPYARSVLDESERILRSAGYFFDAAVRPVRYEDGRVDIEVVTRDVWTLQGGVGFGRSGGVNSTKIGIEDANFLGTGKSVSLRRTSNVDRTETRYRYRDRNVFGTRGQLQLWYSDNSDGRSTLVQAERPFYSLATRWAAGVKIATDDRVDPLYDRGAVTARFDHRASLVEGFVGISRGLVDGSTRRFTFGVTAAEDRFGVARDFAAPAALPDDRKLVYPWIGIDIVQDEFIETRDLDKLRRTEDLNLGRQFHSRLGWSAPAFGGDRGRAIYELAYQDGMNPGDGQMLFVSGSIEGRWGSGGAENVVAGVGMRYYVRNLGENVFFASLRVDAAESLDGDRQLLLGGDSGLRGYPLRFMSGDRRVLLTLEQRFYTDWHLLKLMHVGAAIFFDAGRAWWQDDPAAGNLTYLKDVGVGLRLGSSRSAKGSLIHIDLAFALDAPPGTARRQFLVTTSDRF